MKTFHLFLSSYFNSFLPVRVAYMAPPDGGREAHYSNVPQSERDRLHGNDLKKRDVGRERMRAEAEQELEASMKPENKVIWENYQQAKAKKAKGETLTEDEQKAMDTIQERMDEVAKDQRKETHEDLMGLKRDIQVDEPPSEGEVWPQEVLAFKNYLKQNDIATYNKISMKAERIRRMGLVDGKTGVEARWIKFLKKEMETRKWDDQKVALEGAEEVSDKELTDDEKAKIKAEKHSKDVAEGKVGNEGRLVEQEGQTGIMRRADSGMVFVPGYYENGIFHPNNPEDNKKYSEGSETKEIKSQKGHYNEYGSFVFDGDEARPEGAIDITDPNWEDQLPVNNPHETGLIVPKEGVPGAPEANETLGDFTHKEKKLIEKIYTQVALEKNWYLPGEDKPRNQRTAVVLYETYDDLWDLKTQNPERSLEDITYEYLRGLSVDPSDKNEHDSLPRRTSKRRDKGIEDASQSFEQNTGQSYESGREMRLGDDSRERGSEALSGDAQRARAQAERRAEKVTSAQTALKTAVEGGNVSQIKQAKLTLLTAYEKAGDSHLYAVRLEGGSHWSHSERAEKLLKPSKALKKAVEAARNALNSGVGDSEMAAVNKIFEDIRVVNVEGKEPEKTPDKTSPDTSDSPSKSQESALEITDALVVQLNSILDASGQEPLSKEAWTLILTPKVTPTEEVDNEVSPEKKVVRIAELLKEVDAQGVPHEFDERSVQIINRVIQVQANEQPLEKEGLDKLWKYKKDQENGGQTLTLRALLEKITDKVVMDEELLLMENGVQFTEEEMKIIDDEFEAQKLSVPDVKDYIQLWKDKEAEVDVNVTLQDIVKNYIQYTATKKAVENKAEAVTEAAVDKTEKIGGGIVNGLSNLSKGFQKVGEDLSGYSAKLRVAQEKERLAHNKYDAIQYKYDAIKSSIKVAGGTSSSSEVPKNALIELEFAKQEWERAAAELDKLQPAPKASTPDPDLVLD